jgi:protein-disulfide isomerase
MDQFNRDVKDPTIQKLIMRDIEDGDQAGVRGTPSVFVNGKSVKNRSLQGLKEMIKKELEQGG